MLNAIMLIARYVEYHAVFLCAQNIINFVYFYNGGTITFKNVKYQQLLRPPYHSIDGRKVHGLIWF
jgi:hypothetical protein